MITIYFNRCFSAYSFLIESLKSKWDTEELKLVVSHSTTDPYLQKVADHFELEPKCDGQDYLNYVLSICQKYQVDVFFPRKHVSYLALHKTAFDALNIKCAFVTTHDHYKLFDHKFNATNELAKQALVKRPEVALVDSFESFEQHYHNIRNTRLDGVSGRYESVCLKPNIGIGGKGFMRISHQRSELDDLFRDSVHSVSYSRLKRTLSTAHPFPELLLSTYLKDKELSVDCIGHQGVLLAAYPRRYINKYEQVFEMHPVLIESCRQICATYQLSYLFNIQFKRHRNEWYFIEVNTRSAAGSHRICALNICPLSVSLKLILNQPPNEDLSIKWGSVVQRSEDYIVLSP